MAVTLEQSRKRERALEEVGRTLAEERVDALRLIKELQGEERGQSLSCIYRGSSNHTFLGIWCLAQCHLSRASDD